MTPSKNPLGLIAVTLVYYRTFAFFRHRQFAEDTNAGAYAVISTVLLLSIFPLWVLAVAATIRHRHGMPWPTATFCWLVCGLGGIMAGSFIFSFFAVVLGM